MSINETENQLLQSQESLAFALQSGHMGTWDIDLQTGKILCSKEMLELWEIDPQEFNNERTMLQCKAHPDDFKKMDDAINYAIANKTIYETEFRIIPKPGKIKWMLSRGRYSYAKNTMEPVRFSGIVYEITERKVREQELSRAIQARDDFFTMASHELKTPLTLLQLQIQVMHWQIKQMTADTTNMEMLETGLKKQQEHLLRISRIVDNILDDAKITEGKLTLQYEEFDMSELISDVLNHFSMSAFLAGIEIHFKPAHVINGRWDRFRLEQVLLNLLINAVRYGNKKPIHVSAYKDGPTAYLIVQDQGIGIKHENQEKIFERFARFNADKDSHGMGLGLYISNNIVKAHGGRFILKSAPEQGSEFTVILPC